MTHGISRYTSSLARQGHEDKTGELTVQKLHFVKEKRQHAYGRLMELKHGLEFSWGLSVCLPN